MMPGKTAHVLSPKMRFIMRIFKLIVSSISVVIAGGLILAGCSGNISILAIVLGYLLATGAAFTLSGCGDEDTGPEMVTNPVPQDIDDDGFDEYADCDDSDAEVNPDAAEICDDGKDNDCDNQIDTADLDCEEIVTNPAPEDYDEDGFYDYEDCDDRNADANPGEVEDCSDGIDNDCDELIDEADSDCEEIVINPGPEDIDGDGYVGDEDCLEGNADVNPDAIEDCYDGIDNDCDTFTDEADDECPEIVVNPAPDIDGDGYVGDEDCLEGNPDVNPGALEDCFDGLDNNCNELVDMEDPECADIITNPAPDDF